MFSDENLVMFGPLHWVFIIGTVVACVLVAVLVARKHDSKTDDRLIFIICAFLMAIEIYKKIYFWIIRGYYPFAYVSWQFCSVPMIIGMAGSLTKNVKFKDACYAFLGFFGIIGGVLVTIVSSAFDEYHEYITIIFHSLTWHSLLAVMGVYMLVSRRLGRDYKKEYWPAFAIFMGAIFIAVVANIIAWNVWFYQETRNDWFNLFYMSPYYINQMPILSTIQQFLQDTLGMWIGFIGYFIAYVFAFWVGSSLVFLITKGIRAFAQVKK